MHGAVASSAAIQEQNTGRPVIADHVFNDHRIIRLIAEKQTSPVIGNYIVVDVVAVTVVHVDPRPVTVKFGIPYFHTAGLPLYGQTGVIQTGIVPIRRIISIAGDGEAIDDYSAGADAERGAIAADRAADDAYVYAGAKDGQLFGDIDVFVVRPGIHMDHVAGQGYIHCFLNGTQWQSGGAGIVVVTSGPAVNITGQRIIIDV